ncbi:MAG: hypothetical protein WCQ67_02490 [Treponema sp.]
MVKRITTILAATALALTPMFAQDAGAVDNAASEATGAVEATSTDEIPLDLDLSNSVTTSSEGGSKSNIAQGLWIEVTSDNTSLVRDIATGKKSGYEFDSSSLSSFANWWFWGNITPSFLLDAEIGVWNFNKTLYQANSYGANVPDTTWGDGLQSLAQMFFSPLYYGNDSGVGVFNKFGFNITTPVVKARIGYGKLKANGMSHFTGIYNVLDQWEDVGNGYLEITNGEKIQKFGNVTVNALAALSLMRASYGTYDMLGVNVGEKFNSTFTFGSTSTESQLFFYNKQNDNAASAYLSLAPIDMLKFEAHGLTYFGTSQEIGLDSSAAAGRVTFTHGPVSADVMQSFAGAKVATVWGDNTTVNADTATTQADFKWDVNNIVSFGFDEGFIMNGMDALADGLWTIRNQPMVDVNLADLTGKDITTSLYGVYNVDRIALATSADRPFVPYFEEAGVEVTVSGIAKYLKKLTADYAAYVSYNDWTAADGKAYNMLYNSIMLNADITDALNVHAGSLIRVPNAEDATVVPFAVAVGASVKTSLPGSPKFWTHLTYGMNPYEYYNYSMYRKDDPSVGYAHRTYLLNCTEKTTDNTTSHISFGLIWDIK